MTDLQHLKQSIETACRQIADMHTEHYIKQAVRDYETELRKHIRGVLPDIEATLEQINDKRISVEITIKALHAS